MPVGRTSQDQSQRRGGSATFNVQKPSVQKTNQDGLRGNKALFLCNVNLMSFSKKQGCAIFIYAFYTHLDKCHRQSQIFPPVSFA